MLYLSPTLFLRAAPNLPPSASISPLGLQFSTAQPAKPYATSSTTPNTRA